VPTQSEFERVHDRGFSVVREAIDQSVVKDWRERLAVLTSNQRMNETTLTAADDFMVHNPMMLDETFYAALEHPSVLEVLDFFLGSTSIAYAFTSSSMPAGGTNYSHRIHVDCPRIIPGYMTNIGMMIALDDFTEDNGATYFLPCSFERAVPPTTDEFFEHAERVFPCAGDLVVFNARTWHSGGENSTDRDRHALTLNACRSFMRQRFDYARMVGDERAASMSPSLRRVLGFDVRVPSSLEEYYLPESQRLYKANQG
jgi:ectoine hydroxylase-related dioxygenase (phytanoyl-CoA dioxygenase family)